MIGKRSNEASSSDKSVDSTESQRTYNDEGLGPSQPKKHRNAADPGKTGKCGWMAIVIKRNICYVIVITYEIFVITRVRGEAEDEC